MENLGENTKRAIESFGSRTLNLNELRNRLSRDMFKTYEKTYTNGGILSSEAAPAIAKAMKEWAIENGATHYCHWFQPLTGQTAEKHDAFIAYDKAGSVIEKFTEKQLIQGEPDASSFPSGGMRSTFEARGYTAWDTGSFAFLRKSGQTTTLCIPSIFISYYGQALDEKTPLLRSVKVLNNSALKMLKFLGNDKATRVATLVGSEQEYFLIDKQFYEQRMDIIMSKRTLFGMLPPKTQQLEDHYFGSIPEKILNFMQDVENELYSLGIPVKTRHNEVAPNQFEIAPLHEEAHVASDHNLLIMETLRDCASWHGLSALLHEKPFAGINGSGKHNNWSIAADIGGNLLEPGDTPQDNVQFLVFLVAVLKGVYKRSDILRVSIANSGNDHRLGANEAPPAIMSVFLGHELDRILNELEKGEVSKVSTREHIELGLTQLPKLQKDNTDRNRTSPFAFTGNKFEFRAVPSSSHIAIPNMVLNTIISEAIDDLLNKFEVQLQKTKDKEQAIFEVLRNEVKTTKSVRFEGDGYSQEWVALAKKRKLPNRKNTAEALSAWKNKDVRKLFIDYNVLTDEEIESRYNVRVEQYKKSIEIEAKTAVIVLETQILPACFTYQRELTNAVMELSSTTGKKIAKSTVLNPQMNFVKDYVDTVSKLILKTASLNRLVDALEKKKSLEDQSSYCATKIIPAMNEVRELADNLEGKTPHDLWPMPTYLDMLFS